MMLKGLIRTGNWNQHLLGFLLARLTLGEEFSKNIIAINTWKVFFFSFFLVGYVEERPW